MLIRMLPVWRFVHGAPNALRSPVQESPTKIIQGGRVTGPATWPYSRHTGEVNQSTTRRFYVSVCLINATALQQGSPKSEIYSKNKT